MRDANGGYGRAGLKEEILERPGRKRNDRLTGQSQCDWQEGVVVGGSRDVRATVGKKREKAPPSLPAWLMWMTGSRCDRLA
jgi:hypothetical protein